MVEQSPEVKKDPEAPAMISVAEAKAMIDAAVNKAVAAATGEPVREKKPYELPQYVIAPKGYYLHTEKSLANAEKIQKATDLMAHAKQHHHGKTIAEYIFVVPNERKEEIEKALSSGKTLFKPQQR